jgi:hypothetical protein
MQNNYDTKRAGKYSPRVGVPEPDPEPVVAMFERGKIKKSDLTNQL